MKRGYLKFWRKSTDSDIWDRPPLYLKVWLWILANVDYKTGEMTLTYEHVADRVSWTEKGHTKIPTKRVIHDILHWMNLNSMLRITKLGEGNRKYTKVSVVNWHTYNSADTVDGNRNETENALSLRSSKHLEEVKEEKKTDKIPADAGSSRPRDRFLDEVMGLYKLSWPNLEMPKVSLFTMWRKRYQGTLGEHGILRAIESVALSGKEFAKAADFAAYTHKVLVGEVEKRNKPVDPWDHPGMVTHPTLHKVQK